MLIERLWKSVARGMASGMGCPLAVAVPAPGATAYPIPLIDAHSQVDHKVNFDRIVPLLNEAGISRMILSTRGPIDSGEIIYLAHRHPDRITPAVRTKSRHYKGNTWKFYEMLNAQLTTPGVGAMAEVILYHARKGNKAPEWIIELDAPQVTAALRATLERGWPFIPHIEFAATARDGDRYRIFMTKIEAMLRAHPGHPFVLIHLGQLSAGEAARLIGAHGNVYFKVSHANPVAVYQSGQPCTNTFVGSEERLTRRWRQLLLIYPNRFILGFDTVWAYHWVDYFVEQVKLWRKVLATLPHKAANKVAHCNAELLWRLKPAKFVKAEE